MHRKALTKSNASRLIDSLKFIPKQSQPQSPNISQFHFTNKQNFTISLQHLLTLLEDICPYFKFYSFTMVFMVFGLVHWACFKYDRLNSQIDNFFYQQDNSICNNMATAYVYIVFMIVIASYIQKQYQFWYITTYIISYFIGYFTLLVKQGTTDYIGHYRIFIATYSIYSLILIQKKLKIIKLSQIADKIKKLSIIDKMKKLSIIEYLTGTKKKNQIDLIQFSYSQRPISIRGGQSDDSFSYDSFFTYNQNLQKPRVSYFQQNISRRNPFINNQSSFRSTKRITSTHPSNSLTEIQSIQEDVIKNQKKQQYQQMIKIYKVIIFSFMVYSTVNSDQWRAYLISIVTSYAWVQLLTNSNYKIFRIIILTTIVILMFCLF